MEGEPKVVEPRKRFSFREIELGGRRCSAGVEYRRQTEIPDGVLGAAKHDQFGDAAIHLQVSPTHEERDDDQSADYRAGIGAGHHVDEGQAEIVVNTIFDCIRFPCVAATRRRFEGSAASVFVPGA